MVTLLFGTDVTFSKAVSSFAVTIWQRQCDLGSAVETTNGHKQLFLSVDDRVISHGAAALADVVERFVTPSPEGAVSADVFLCITNVTERTHAIRQFTIEHPFNLEGANVTQDLKIRDAGSEVSALGVLNTHGRCV